MKTTIEIPDALFHRAKVASAQRRVPFRQLVVEGLEKTLAEPHKAAPIQLTPEQSEIFEICEAGFPVLKKRPVPPPEEFLAIIESIREELGD